MPELENEYQGKTNNALPESEFRESYLTTKTNPNQKNIPRIALLIDSTQTARRDFLGGIAKYSKTYGPWLFYTEQPSYYKLKNIEPNLAKQLLLSNLKKWNPDGIILQDSYLCEELDDLNIPTIVLRTLGINLSSHPVVKSVDDDDSEIGKLAAEHFLIRGYRDFAYCGFKGASWSDNRKESFAQRISKLGFKTNFYEPPKNHEDILWKDEQPYLIQWLKTLPKPIALMACNDDRAQNVLDAARVANVFVPEELAIIGVDNDELICNLTTPPLSSVAVNKEKAGYEAAAIMDKMLRGEKIQECIIAPAKYVVTRESTDITSITDPEINKALKFISEHNNRPLQVNEVVEAVCISRRILEKRFRKILGRSLHKEIRRIHIREICQMLLDTNLTVAEIAERLHHTSDKHFSRYFQREKGISPLQYRKKHQHE